MRIKKTALIVASAIVTVLLGVSIAGPGADTPGIVVNHTAAGHKLTVYKSATCGCCSIWVDYMKDKGYDVGFVDTEELDTIKEQYSVPESLHSCHTTIIDDGEYFVEGHIPEEAVNKLLTDKPGIEGIGMPGMPSASPGMPGPKLAPFEIEQVLYDGLVSRYMSI